MTINNCFVYGQQNSRITNFQVCSNILMISALEKCFSQDICTWFSFCCVLLCFDKSYRAQILDDYIRGNEVIMRLHHCKWISYEQHGWMHYQTLPKTLNESFIFVMVNLVFPFKSFPMRSYQHIFNFVEISVKLHTHWKTTIAHMPSAALNKNAKSCPHT